MVTELKLSKRSRLARVRAFENGHVTPIKPLPSAVIESLKANCAKNDEPPYTREELEAMCPGLYPKVN